MAAQAASTFTFPTSKRSACDRCRKQKLRCPSRASEAQPCSRCIRAGVECITGYTRPLGRSHRIYHGSANSKVGQSHVFPVACSQPLALDTSRAVQDEQTSPSATIPKSSRPMQTVSSRPPMGVVNSPSWLFNEVEDIDTSPYVYHDALENLSGEPFSASAYPMNPSYISTKFDNNPEFSPLSPQQLDLSETTLSSQFTSGDDSSSTFGTENVVNIALSGVDCDLRISQLIVDLCHQARRNMTGDRQSGRAQTGTYDQSREFGDALCSTSEFLSIIQSKIHDVEPDVPITTGKADRPLTNLSWALNLITCYLRLVAIFERLVLQLHEQMICNGSETPPSNSSADPAGPQTLPGLYLASFHVQQSKLQTKILIKIIEHQFEMIEKGLGLPIELRVSSDHREPYEGGLLRSGLDKDLLQALIIRLCTWPEAESTVGKAPVPGSLASLRENVLNVRRLLAT